jgi:polysaccharide export outer membrane protein
MHKNRKRLQLVVNRSLTTFAVLCTAVLSNQMQAQRESVLIGAGDMLHVQVYDTPEMDQHIMVNDSGNAPLLFVGQISLAGKTPDQAAQAVSSAMVLKHVMQHPQVAVTIEKPARLDVSVGGEVNHVGTYSLTTPRPVLDVLDMAGGLTPMADRNIVIEHRGPAHLTETYFVSNEDPGGTAGQLKVWPGDRITVPRAGIVYVLGDVGRPGGYPLNSNDSAVTLMQALGLAQSPNKTSAYSKIKLLRRSGEGYTIVPVKVNDIKAGKASDPVLQPNDVVMVPFSYIKNFAINSTSVLSSVGTAAIYVH